MTWGLTEDQYEAMNQEVYIPSLSIPTDRWALSIEGSCDVTPGEH
jgi:hypothetical protein